jgi:hypothetical protein
MLFTLFHFRTQTVAVDNEDSDRIELATIKVSEGVSTPEERATVAATHNAGKSAVRSNASGRRTPPPLYSLDGLYR